MDESPETSHSSNGAIDWAGALAIHRRWLRTVVFARVGDAHAVDEIMQNVSMAAVKQDSTPQAGFNVPAWLYRVAIRQTLLYRRSAGREKRRIEGLAARQRNEPTNGQVPDPLHWLLAAEERELVRRALEELPPRDRELLLLKYTENWTCRELAERLGIRITAVESRLDRARRRLRQALARYELRDES
jgi:RNA polymerase sigma-70 factor (ECF subfamily)